jgi:hypothetical protein
VYQDGRGSDPMMDVGSVFPADALNISCPPNRLRVIRADAQTHSLAYTRVASRTAEHGEPLAVTHVSPIASIVPGFLYKDAETEATTHIIGRPRAPKAAALHPGPKIRPQLEAEEAIKYDPIHQPAGD